MGDLAGARSTRVRKRRSQRMESGPCLPSASKIPTLSDNLTDISRHHTDGHPRSLSCGDLDLQRRILVLPELTVERVAGYPEQ